MTLTPILMRRIRIYFDRCLKLSNLAKMIQKNFKNQQAKLLTKSKTAFLLKNFRFSNIDSCRENIQSGTSCIWHILKRKKNCTSSLTKLKDDSKRMTVAFQQHFKKFLSLNKYLTLTTCHFQKVWYNSKKDWTCVLKLSLEWKYSSY